MRTWTQLFNLVAALAIVILIASYINICEVMDREFNQARFDYATQQATEAMFRQTLRAEDIDLDYTDMSYIQIDSSNALEVFDRVMCANYNMAPSQANFATINDSITACVIAGYDGYYILRFSETDIYENQNPVDGYSPKFSVKIPYFVEKNNKVYGLDSYKKTHIAMSTANNSANPELYLAGATWPSGVSEETVKSNINQQVRAAILDELKNSSNASIGSLDEFVLLFPDETTMTGVNPFDVPAIFIILDGSDYAGTREMQGMSVGGYKVIKKRQVISFVDTRTNRAYYCYEGQMLDIEKDAASGGTAMDGAYGTFKIENYYNTAKKACEDISPTTGTHYAPYYDLLTRKSTKK